MSAISSNLLHFLARNSRSQPLQQLEVFKKIICNGFKASDSYIKYEAGTFVKSRVACFTDLPLSQCSEHSEIYGKFGIGVKKSYVKNIGGNPVRYLVNSYPSGNLQKNLDVRGFLYQRTNQLINPLIEFNNVIDSGNELFIANQDGTPFRSTQFLRDLYKSALDIHGFDKETGDLGIARDENDSVDPFYEEREWRIIPISDASGNSNYIVNQSEIYFPLRRQNINMVVVPNDDIRIEVIKFFFSLGSSDNPDLSVYSTNMPTVINYDDLSFW